MSDQTITSYLDHPPYYGRSEYRHLKEVKKLAGPTCCYDAERKLWGTTCLDALQYLVASKKWTPVGIPNELHAPLVRAARDSREQAEAEWVALDEVEAAAEAEAKAKADAEAKRQPSSWVKPGARPKKQPKPRGPWWAPAPAPAPEPEPEPVAKRDGIEPTAAEVAECARLGFTAEAIAFSKSDDALGPRGSLSDEGRVLRWCLLDLKPDESVRELTPEERRHSWGGREVRWTLPEAASRAYAAKLNERAMQAAAEAAA